MSKSKREAIPYHKIAKMRLAGKDYMAIAQATGRVDKGNDKTKSVRAICSRMRTEGYADENGKVVKLKDATRAVSKTPKVVKAKTGKRGRPAGSKNKPKVTKAVVIVASPDGKHIRLNVPQASTLIPLETFEKKTASAIESAKAKAAAAAASPASAPAGEATQVEETHPEQAESTEKVLHDTVPEGNTAA
jgi:hypothetical protein